MVSVFVFASGLAFEGQSFSVVFFAGEGAKSLYGSTSFTCLLVGQRLAVFSLCWSRSDGSLSVAEGLEVISLLVKVFGWSLCW